MAITAELYFAKLRNALVENGVSLIGISFGAFSDDSLCLEEKNGKWIVYSAERGNQFDVSEFDSVKDACLEVIHRVSASDMEEEHIRNSFYDSLSPSRDDSSVLEKQAEANADCSKAMELLLDYEEEFIKRKKAMRKEMMADYLRTVELKYDLAEAYNRRGFVYNTLGKYKEALTDYTNAISLLTMLLEMKKE